MSTEHSQRPIVYVVEMLDDDEGWQPCSGMGLNLHAARMELDRWKATNPDDTFRLGKYRQDEPAF